MRVDPLRTGGIVWLRGVVSRPRGGRKEGVDNLRGLGEEWERLREVVRRVLEKIPDIRQDEIERIRMLMRSRKWKADPEKIAEAMVEEILRMRGVLRGEENG